MVPDLGWWWLLFVIPFSLGIAAVIAVPTFACLWHEDGCLNRRRQRRPSA